jgi:putative flippase GtrA
LQSPAKKIRPNPAENSKITTTFAAVMRKILTQTGALIRKAIDFTYPPFRRFINPQLYRYGICGSANVFFDWILYFFVYNYVISYNLVGIGFVTLSPHIATLIIIFPVSTFSGFLLQKYVTFTASDLRGVTQLMRYLIVVFTNLLINYIGLKILVDGMNFYPTPSKMIITVITVACSYVGQKKFTFR